MTNQEAAEVAYNHALENERYVVKRQIKECIECLKKIYSIHDDEPEAKPEKYTSIFSKHEPIEKDGGYLYRGFMIGTLDYDKEVWSIELNGCPLPHKAESKGKALEYVDNFIEDCKREYSFNRAMIKEAVDRDKIAEAKRSIGKEAFEVKDEPIVRDVLAPSVVKELTANLDGAETKFRDIVHSHGRINRAAVHEVFRKFDHLRGKIKELGGKGGSD